MVDYPPGEPQDVCAICGEPFTYDAEFAIEYANLVCRDCDERAVTADGTRPTTGNEFLGKETLVDADSESLTIRMAPDTQPLLTGRNAGGATALAAGSRAETTMTVTRSTNSMRPIAPIHHREHRHRMDIPC
jgi:hypothetical protein